MIVIVCLEQSPSHELTHCETLDERTGLDHINIKQFRQTAAKLAFGLNAIDA